MDCARCGHPRESHKNNIKECQKCDCVLFMRGQANLPSEPRQDLNLKYRIGPGEIITWTCPDCGHYELADYAGLDLATVKGKDFKINKDFNILCNGCEKVYNIPGVMDRLFLRRGAVPLETMAKNPNMSDQTREKLGDKLADFDIEKAIADADK